MTSLEEIQARLLDPTGFVQKPQSKCLELTAELPSYTISAGPLPIEN